MNSQDTDQPESQEKASKLNLLSRVMRLFRTRAGDQEEGKEEQSLFSFQFHHLNTLKTNLKKLPSECFRSIFRHGYPESDKSRSETIFWNFFLHIHPVKVNRSTLRFTTTLALGILSFWLFIILVVTGILLMFYYVPAIPTAYERMKDIEFTVTGGRLIRNIHRWAAHGMVITVLLHMARVFYTGSYKAERRFNWVLGVFLLVLTLALSFTGYLLPWDQLAFWAVTIGSNIAASPRELTDALGITQYFDIGGLQRQLLLGGNVIGQDALLRFYVLHCALLPALLLVIVAVHFWRVRKDGGLARPAEGPETPGPEAELRPQDATSKTYGLMAVVRGKKPLVGVDPDTGISSWPSLVIAEFVVLLATLVILFLIGLAFDAPLKEIANPYVPENPAKAPWYFLGLQEMVSYSAFVGGLGVPLLVVFWLISIPYLDLETANSGVWFGNRLDRKIIIQSLAFGAVSIILLLAFTVKYGWLRNWFPTIPQIVIVLVNPGTIIVCIAALWHLYILLKTGSTRKALLGGFTYFVIGFLVLTIMGTYFRGPNWDFYWSHASWPGLH